MRRTPFLVGIDLGTTNSAIAAADGSGDRRPALVPIPQITAPFTIDPQPALPSFLYFPQPDEAASGSVALPWNRAPAAVAGLFARERGALAPGRQVVSAKSWLAHRRVDRRAPLLPWEGDPSVPKISPVDASAAYLAHIRDAWNATIAQGRDTHRLERQSIVLAVPASFDEEARELTVEAAAACGLTDLTLLEEPIAAFYAWLGDHHIGERLPHDDSLALVCDVGGGTTDFSLIRIRFESGEPAFERIAIGDHLLLGGDNLDLAIARVVEDKLVSAAPGLRLAISERRALVRQCTAAKEQLLGDDPPPRVAITLLGAGRSVIGAARTAELTGDDVREALAQFLPVAADPGESGRAARPALRELGLPYESDPAITRHLAAFLARSAALLPEGHRALAGVQARSLVRPDLLLFNGGFFTPQPARDRVAAALAAWFGEPPQVLPSRALGAAVAIGAATYAQLRAGVGRAALIRAGSAHAYYIGLQSAQGAGQVSAVCVLARGTDEGTRLTLDHPFRVATNTPVAFALYSSPIRPDRAGDLVTLELDEVQDHAPLVTVLRYGRKSRQVELPVRLAVGFTETGTLEIWCESQASDHRWRLQFQLRGSAEPIGPAEPAPPEAEAVVPDEAIGEAVRVIRAVFQGDGGDPGAEGLVARLEQIFGFAKTAWPVAAIRRLADVLIDVADGRRRSPRLEARWLNLFGFCLRPGFGAAKDPWRVSEARKVYVAGLAFPNALQNRAEWLVLLQRVAGGFSAGQQRELAQRMAGELGLTGRKGARPAPQLERESWRLLGSLERLEADARAKLGDQLLARMRKPGTTAFLWAMARLGARTPLYGPLNAVVPPDVAARWVREMLASKALKAASPDFVAAVVQTAARTGDPLRDLPPDVLAEVREALLGAGVGPQALRPIDEVVAMTEAEASRVFGEPLPHGLRLEVEA